MVTVRAQAPSAQSLSRNWVLLLPSRVVMSKLLKVSNPCFHTMEGMGKVPSPNCAGDLAMLSRRGVIVELLSMCWRLLSARSHGDTGNKSQLFGRGMKMEVEGSVRP